MTKKKQSPMIEAKSDQVCSTRRNILRGAIFGGGALGLSSLVTGLPTSFLRSGSTAFAAERDGASYLLLSASASGHPINANAPGTYGDPKNSQSLLHQLDHPNVAELGVGALGKVGSIEFSSDAYSTPTEVKLGERSAWAASPWAALPESLRKQLHFLHHPTFANSHSEFSNVMGLQGAVKAPGRLGSESLPSMIAQENAKELKTLVAEPINLGASTLTFEGRPLGTLEPTQLQSLFSGGNHPTRLDPRVLARTRDRYMDKIYKDLKRDGTPAQLNFLERYAQSRKQAMELGEALGPMLVDVDPTAERGDARNQIRVALALIKLEVSPVIGMQLAFGGDNHQDDTLEDEARETIASLDAMCFLWEQLEIMGLQSKVSIGYLDTFGRSLKRNASGGRNHNADHHVMMLAGPRVRGGVTGGIVAKKSSYAAASLPDVPDDLVLASVGRTLAAACGVRESILQDRITEAQTLSGVVA